MDKVKITNIKEVFRSPDDLSKKLVEVERSKDGVFEVSVISASENSVSVVSSPSSSSINSPSISSSLKEMTEIDSSSTNTIPAYTIDYVVESSRGTNHYVAKSVVFNRRLFVATAQSKKDDFDLVKPEITSILDSFHLLNKQ